MAERAHILRPLIGLLILGTVSSCTLPVEGADPLRPTVRPLLRVTPAPVQDVKGTATSFALRIVPTATPIGLYIVKPGDTLSLIADNFETTVDEIMALNNLSDPNQIEVGRSLTIPSLLPPPTPEGAPAATTPEAVNTSAPEEAPSAAPEVTTATP
jgi:LysM repeat protein